ncbi:hypothetical protein AB0284_09660 [Pseudarthrobacter phenanthrenivorans]|jgi:hypothetical protein|uniref:hypothetical protein n=1 Tax=Pseudarthrobacter phenanthrenivorans TaxID=361575 RepID=UPI0034508D26
MMHGATFSGNLFFDPLATNLGSALGGGPAAAKGPVPARVPVQEQADPSGPPRRRGVQSPAEHKALRAASLSKVSRDLERMLRERKR